MTMRKRRDPLLRIFLYDEERERGFVVVGVNEGEEPGRAFERLRLPCFWFRPRTAVLPAFGEFTGLADVDVEDGDRVWVVAGNDVLAIRIDDGRVG